mgnify:CR=1 FL=1
MCIHTRIPVACACIECTSNREIHDRERSLAFVNPLYAQLRGSCNWDDQNIAHQMRHRYGVYNRT